MFSSLLVAACRLFAAMRMWALGFLEHLPIGQQNLHGAVDHCLSAKEEPRHCDTAKWLPEFHVQLPFRPKSQRCDSAMWPAEYHICFVQGLDIVSLPRGLQSIAFGDDLIDAYSDLRSLEAYGVLLVQIQDAVVKFCEAFVPIHICSMRHASR